MVHSGNRVVVRSRVTVTPNGAVFGVDVKGKSLTILTIDLHTIEDGKISATYHVEDWAGAQARLKAE